FELQSSNRGLTLNCFVAKETLTRPWGGMTGAPRPFIFHGLAEWGEGCWAELGAFALTRASRLSRSAWLCFLDLQRCRLWLWRKISPTRARCWSKRIAPAATA